MIHDHTSEQCQSRWIRLGAGRHNGAYYYSKEITENIIPRINTDRNWVTINNPGCCWDHSVVFIHNNQMPGLYEWLKDYKDLILVCGVPETCDKVKNLGHAVYLPLSVDTEYVQSFGDEKTKDTAYAGRPDKKTINLPEGIDYLQNLPRPLLLKEMAKYRRIYAVGRTAIEAKILGCEILPYDPRYPDPERWQILDNAEAAEQLQKILDKIDK